MRILSQDADGIGMFDVPYELCVVSTGKSKKTGNPCIYVRCNLFGEYSVVAAEYSTIEKTKKALEMLNNAYQYAEECKYTGVGATQPEFVFVFPSDDEVEV